jgi:hypothetical protein
MTLRCKDDDPSLQGDSVYEDVAEGVSVSKKSLRKGHCKVKFGVGCSQVPRILWEQLLVGGGSDRARSMVAHNAANVSVV